MKQYNSYKDSGIEWLGQIPKDWLVSRVKDYAISVKTGSTPSSKNGDFFTDGTENWYTPSDINNGILNFSQRKVIKKAFIDKEIHIYPKNSIYLIGIGGTLGKVGISPILSGCNQQINVIVFNNSIIEKYAFYQLLVTGNTLIKWSNYTTMPIFTQTDTKRLKFIVPPLQEQKAIAQYLDNKTQAIDKKISLLNQKIDYYKEVRQSLINDAVTKGLDNKVTLKETEIFVRVPQHWKRYRLKEIGNLFSGLSGKSGDDFRQDDDPNNKYYIPFTNIAANTYISKDNLGSVVIEPTEKQNKVKKGDLFFLMSSEGYEDIGKSSVLNIDLEETYLNSFCKGFRLKGKFNDPHFLNYLLLSDSYRQLLIIEGKGFTRINLKMEKVNDFFVHLPPTKEEQHQIAQYLDKKTNTIDAIVNNIVEQIEKLKELRKTLINDVVTGKIKVA